MLYAQSIFYIAHGVVSSALRLIELAWIVDASGQLIYADRKPFPEHRVVLAFRGGSKFGVHDSNKKADREVCLPGIELLQLRPEVLDCHGHDSTR